MTLTETQPTMTYMGINSAEAIQRLIALAFPDIYTILDLTYGNGGFWKLGEPENKILVTNNIDPESDTSIHLDFTNTGFPDKVFDLVCYDPPHLADSGESSMLVERYGTIKGTEALKKLVSDGAKEAWRICNIGIIVKIVDYAHGGYMVLLSDVVKEAIPVPLYCYMHTYRTSFIKDTKHKQQRVPRSNGATYLVFRRGNGQHQSFEDYNDV